LKSGYRLTTQARRDFRAIWEFIALDDIDAADRVAGRLEKAFQLLTKFPRKGHMRSDVSTSEPVLFWIAGSYVIVYRPTPKPLQIVRIVHGSRDLGALFDLG